MLSLMSPNVSFADMNSELTRLEVCSGMPYRSRRKQKTLDGRRVVTEPEVLTDNAVLRCECGGLRFEDAHNARASRARGSAIRLHLKSRFQNKDDII